MKVLLVSGDFKHGGGMDRANYELAWHLAEDTGASVYLVAYHVAEPLASHPNVVWLPVPKPLRSYSLGASLLAKRGRTEARWIEQQGGRTIVNGGNCCWPDINWVHAVHQSWGRRLAHAPAPARIRQWLSRRKALRVEKLALGLARMVVTNSEQTRAKLIELFGIPADRIRTVYLGVDPQVFRPAPPDEKLAVRTRLGWPAGRLTAVFAGALGYDRNKGFDLLFEAWRQLCADPGWDVDLVAAGGGAEVTRWRSQSEKAGLSSRIRMTGFTQDVPALLRAADVMVQPSFYEAYGLSAHEALCCGVPALVTRSSGVAERYPLALSDLLLDHPPSAQNLVDSLRRWRANWQWCRARVQTLSGKLRQRSWTDMAREFVEWTMPSLVEPVAALSKSPAAHQAGK
jgi:glycosyltransferase involved in cell wall biosynthesis